jgi:hypothetical protein
MPPQVGVGAFTPTPRKLSDASSRIAAPKPMDACTMTGASVLGIRWYRMTRLGDAPVAMAEAI